MPETFSTFLHAVMLRLEDEFARIFGLSLSQFGTLSASGSADDVELIYAEDGTLLTRIEVRADGLRQEDSYADGVRIATTLSDVEDTETWTSITNRYDETGRIAKETVIDDGQVRLDEFISGVRVRTVQTDPADVDQFDWVTRDVAYDGAGTPISRFTRYDDGTSRAETFETDNRAVVVQEDLVLSARVWEQIETLYDQVGRVLGREMVFDDGTSRTDQFSAGVRQQTVISDPDDVEDWSEIVYIYNFAGVITSRQRFDDNGDISLWIYEDGTRSERILQDVDGDMPWEVQVTVYDEDGVAGVTEFSDGTTILEDYAPFFETDVFLI